VEGEDSFTGARLPARHNSNSIIDANTWPGNVRELENVIQRAVVLAEGSTIEVWHLPAKLRGGVEPLQTARSYEEELRDFKRRLRVRTLWKCNGNKAEAARVLELARGYLHRLIHDLKIQSDETSPAACGEHQTVPQIVM
jgi:DNA-binding NtrC family response regulator